MLSLCRGERQISPVQNLIREVFTDEFIGNSEIMQDLRQR